MHVYILFVCVYVCVLCKNQRHAGSGSAFYGCCTYLDNKRRSKMWDFSQTFDLIFDLMLCRPMVPVWGFWSEFLWVVLS